MLCSIKVRTSSAILSLAAVDWCSLNLAIIASSAGLIGGASLPSGAEWPFCVFFSSVLNNLLLATVLIILGANAIACDKHRKKRGLNFIFGKKKIDRRAVILKDYE